MVGKDLIMATLFGSGGGSSGSGGGGIPQEDIDAAFAALAEKGVTVPDGATSADLDDLIASIVTGSGGAAIAVGSVTLTADQGMTESKLRDVEHGLGAIPKVLVLHYDCTTTVGTSAALAAEIFVGNHYMARFFTTSSAKTYHKENDKVWGAFASSATDNVMWLDFYSDYRVSSKCPAGTTITWVACA